MSDVSLSYDLNNVLSDSPKVGWRDGKEGHVNFFHNTY